MSISFALCWSVFAKEDFYNLESRYLLIKFSEKGELRRIYNKKKNLELMSKSMELPPWELKLDERPMIKDSESFSFEKIYHKGKDGIYQLEWKVRDLPIRIICRAFVSLENSDINFELRIINGTSNKIISFTFPVIRGISSLSEETEFDFLVHPSGGGLLIKNPMKAFNPENPKEYISKFAFSEYPDGFHGSPMQFIEYFKKDLGGFYFATHDPYSTGKEFNFYKDFDNDNLYLRLVHYNWDLRRDNSSELSLGYPIVFSSLMVGDWYEGAEKYRNWVFGEISSTPPWSTKNSEPENQNNMHHNWIKGDIGLGTFGISSRRDQSSLFRSLKKAFKTNILHVTAFDWENNDTANTDWGYDDIDICHIDNNNLNAIKNGGDYFALYKTDCFISTKCKNYLNVFNSSGTDIFFVDRNNRSEYMCPLDKEWIEFYSSRDILLTSSDNIKSDAIYNDISICNSAPIYCENILHSHPQGVGRGMINAYRSLILESKKRCTSKNPSRYIPFGTELIIENFVDIIDFYHARGYAGVQGFFEWNGDISGMIEKIPLFTYVYHENGPVRFDGFLKLSKEFGEIFYFIAARVILWGGVPELNYEFSSPELLEGISGPTYFVTYDYWTNWIKDKKPYKADPDKVEFLRESIKARTEFGRKYLVYGKMVRPPEISNEISQLELDYFHYNTFIDGGDRMRKGLVNVPSVLGSAYTYKDESLGIFLINLHKSESLNINIKVNPKDYNLHFVNPVLVLKTGDRDLKLDKFNPLEKIEVQLPPRKIGMIELFEGQNPK